MENTINLVTGFDKYDYDNWFCKKYEFTDSKTNEKFYTSQHEYYTLKQQHISDYSYDVRQNPYYVKINENSENPSIMSKILNIKIF